MRPLREGVSGVDFTALDSIIGTPGFSAPPLDALDYVAIRNAEDAKALEAHGVTIVSDRPWDGEVLAHIWLNKAICKRSIKLSFRPASGNASIVLARAQGLSGNVQIAAKNCVLIDCGHDHRKNTANIALWSDGGLFYWGYGATSNGLYAELHGDGRSVLFGEDCMLASDIIIRPTDMHAIFDVETRQVVNRSASGRIEVGPHVWLGQRVFVGKDVVIGKGSIIGSGSSVTRTIPEFSLAVGVPAKVVRSGVTWSRSLYPTDADMDAEIARLTPLPG